MRDSNREERDRLIENRRRGKSAAWRDRQSRIDDDR